MKKNTLSFLSVTIILLLVYNFNTIAQSGEKYSIDANNLSVTDKLGSKNNAPLRLVTNNLERVRITETGNVLVGLSSSAYKFDVNGSLHSINAFVDSVINVWQVMVADALNVGGNVNIGGSLNIGQFTLSGNNIISSSGNINFGNNNLTTTGNITAGTISSSNITAITSDVDSLQLAVSSQQSAIGSLQTAVGGQQVEIDTLQSIVGNIQTSQWQNNDSNIFYNDGFVGIGTNSPAVKLDVYGNQRITKNLFVGGEVVVSEKFSARTVATDTMRAEKQLFVNHNLKLGSDSGSVTSDIASKTELLKIQSDPASVFDVAISVNDSSRVGIGTKYPSEKLSVEGNVSVSGNFKTAGSLTFAGNKEISYQPTTGNFGNYRIGPPPPPVDAPCFSPPTNNLTFNGTFYTWGHESWDSQKPITVMQMGYDGANAIIDVAGIKSDGSSPSLLINYYCGKNVVVGGGGPDDPNLPATGTFTTRHSAYLAANGGDVGIGTSTPGAKLDVEGNVRISNLTAPSGTNNIVQVGDNGILTSVVPASAGIGLWQQSTININDIYTVNTGNTGIGTNNPTEKLTVTNGNILVKGNNNFSTSGDEAVLFLGDNYHYIKSINGGGLRIGTYQSPDAIMLMQNNGYVGVGTNNPDSKLSVTGNIHSTGSIINGSADFILGVDDGRDSKIKTANRALVHDGWETGQDNLVINYDGDFEDGVFVGGPKTVFDGYVGIGTACPNERLTVNGKIRAKDEIIIESIGSWCDYVFDNNYKLMSFSELEKYLLKHKHLPGIKSASEMEKSGFSVLETNKQMMEKIEELTLYILQLEKRISELEKK